MGDAAPDDPSGPSESDTASPDGALALAENIGLQGWEAALGQCVRPDGSVSVRILPPHFDLQLRRCSPSAWQRFHAHHYKTSELSKVATCFLLEAEIRVTRERTTRLPVGFVATIPHSGKRTESASAPPHRAHRTVVLPEFQGMGIGSRLSDAAAEWHHRNGSDYYGQTAHPRFGAYRDHSPLWAPLEANHTAPQLRWLPRRLTGFSRSNVVVRRRHPKLVYAHRYVGDGGSCGDDEDGVLISGERHDLQRVRHLKARVRFL